MTMETSAVSGFGSYDLPEGQSFEEMQTSAKAHAIFFVVLYGSLTALSCVLIPVSIPLGLMGASVFSYQTIKSILKTVGIYYRSPPMQMCISQEVQKALPAIGEQAKESFVGLVTKNGVESHEWKLNLIRNAKQNILLSGCYCGGDAFDEVLELIEEKMVLNKTLTANLLSSDLFITDKNKTKIDLLQEKFPDRFACLITPEMFLYLSPITGELSTCTNHTKALITDYGTSFMLGGSGIVSPWSKQEGASNPIQVESHGIFYDYFLTIKSYRDMDFVFQGPQNSIGTKLYVEMMKLFHRFLYKAPKELELPLQETLPPFPLPTSLDKLKIACYVSGPETPSEAFLDDLVTKINQATKTIHIDHMYFIPPEKLLKALLDAANRGVKITLLTNQMAANSPGCHYGYAELSRFYVQSLFQAKQKPDCYYFAVPSTTLHKKVIVIDEKTSFVGSSNIGPNSLLSFHYEINLQIDSEEFADSLLNCIEEDKKLSQKEEELRISLTTRIYSSLQEFCISLL
jgi:HKD family nuclease